MSAEYRKRIEELMRKLRECNNLTPDDKEVLVFILTYIKDRDAFVEDRDTIE